LPDSTPSAVKCERVLDRVRVVCDVLRPVTTELLEHSFREQWVSTTLGETPDADALVNVAAIAVLLVERGEQ
jgi:hypothetical protein